MADLQAQSTVGKGHRKIATPRIDLTPMVDLGFLLITFFMYTTTLAKPKVMEIQMPYKDTLQTTQTSIPAEATLILIPSSGHRVAYYRGSENPAESLSWCSFRGANNLRLLLDAEQKRVSALPSPFSREAHKLHVLIKPDIGTVYDDMVRAVDEMTIGDVPYYTIMRAEAAELSALKNFSVPSYGNRDQSGL